jgi:Domain of unknown function (DUF1707)/Cell wall-active antibiotics response 4TMS YvqF
MSDPQGPDTALPVPRETHATPALRAADTDRHRVTEILRDAAGEGRIDLAELDERLERALTAKTYADLEALIADLPGSAAPAPVPERETMALKVRSGNAKQVGYWVVPPHITAECGMGNIKIDFTEAVCRHREVVVDVTCGAGDITLIVPRGWSARMDEVAVGMGDAKNKATDPPDSGAPTLRVRGRVKSGDVTVRYPRRSRRPPTAG